MPAALPPDAVLYRPTWPYRAMWRRRLRRMTGPVCGGRALPTERVPSVFAGLPVPTSSHCTDKRCTIETEHR